MRARMSKMTSIKATSNVDGCHSEYNLDAKSISHVTRPPTKRMRNAGYGTKVILVSVFLFVAGVVMVQFDESLLSDFRNLQSIDAHNDAVGTTNTNKGIPTDTATTMTIVRAMAATKLEAPATTADDAATADTNSGSATTAGSATTTSEMLTLPRTSTNIAADVSSQSLLSISAVVVPTTSASIVTRKPTKPSVSVRVKRKKPATCYRRAYGSPRVVTYAPDFEFDLKVPFYVYDNELNMADMKSCGIPIEFTDYTHYKHSDDYWMLQSALVHPMRTNDPDKARLFFVPLMLNAVADSYAYKNRNLCIQGGKVCFDNELRSDATLGWTDKHLAQSSHFQRSNGTDHVLVLSHFLGQASYNMFGDYEHLLSCNRIIFEDFAQRRPNSTAPDRIELPGLYVANFDGCAPTTQGKRTDDFAMIANMHPLNPDFEDRGHICDWLKQGNYSHSTCGRGAMCPALADARFGFHPRGDTFGSNRAFDIVASDAVPIFTRKEQYDIMPEFAPFREMSFFVDVTSAEAFHASLKPLMEMSQQEYNDKLEIMRKHASRVDVKSGEPFDAYMATFARKLRLQD